MNASKIQLIECVTIANEDYLQSLLAVGFYALVLPVDLWRLSEQLNFLNTPTKILHLEDEMIAIQKQGNTITTLDQAYQAGNYRFYSAIRGCGGYLPTEKLLTYFQKQHLLFDVNLLAFEAAYNEALNLIY